MSDQRIRGPPRRGCLKALGAHGYGSRASAPMKNPSSRSDAGQTVRPQSRPSTTPDPLLGTQVGDFVIQQRIGSGGMGVVYRAVHPLIGKQAAIKVLRLELVSEQLVQRLLVEARAVNAVRHPGIIDIFGFGSLPDERPYVIMELLQGRPLSDFVRAKQPMELESVVWVMDQMLAALGAAHRAGVVHRDLKPANVFIAETPQTPASVKLVDFGIAKLLESHDTPLTADGSVIGTPEYMAPEQIRSGGDVSPATDLYAVGVMMFQMLTGVRPFLGDSVQVMFAHVEERSPAPSSRVPGLPLELDSLVLQLLQKDPTRRPSSAEAVRERLKRIPLRSAPQAPSLPRPDATPMTTPSAGDTVTHTTTQDGLNSIRLSPGLRWVLAGAVLLLGAGAAVIQYRTPAPVPAVTSEPPSAHVATAPARTEPAQPQLQQDSRSEAQTPPPALAPAPELKPEPPEEPTTLATLPESSPPPVQAQMLPPPSMSIQDKKDELLGRIKTLVAKMRIRNGGNDLPEDIVEEQVMLLNSIATAKARKDLAKIKEALNDWEHRLEQRFPAR
ncbi:serine/threonine-protein kinase [Corallococcus sp. AS-1-6]|uniref:serine/threonine-protein kinase n=1 Tax=Corallococcus TaxID=83461 RepID=UPI001CBE454F|nr:serine/threonine-protein kinase [Corallococcus sp. AS-1-6]MBZ4373944.1 serine/threonine protein kinase [Corallococcus sp. AS-1-6]